jgi:ubiquinone/menaquinone biosynthesis C-methylase UbiE
MGYFSLGLARLVGENGKVIAADLQPEMLAGLSKRVKALGLASRIQPQRCAANAIGVSEPIDFALAFWMVHEVRQRREFLQEVFNLLTPGGGFLIVEPTFRVSKREFDRTLAFGQDIGFRAADRPKVNLSRAVLLEKVTR